MKKHASMDPEEDGLGPSTPVLTNNPRNWASPSYDGAGRACNFEEKGNRQVPKAGRHTIGNNTKKPSRPGRW